MVPKIQHNQERDFEVASIYLIPPSFAVWFQRLWERSKNDPKQRDEVIRRLTNSVALLEKIAGNELSTDLVIVNDTKDNISVSAKMIKDILNLA